LKKSNHIGLISDVIWVEEFIFERIESIRSTVCEIWTRFLFRGKKISLNSYLAEPL
jgi:hypothetical protein